jgi:glycosyltransferase involved in cell wall biosynthesis
MPPFAPSLTIVIPAYNERDNLGRVVSDALIFGRAACSRFELLVIDDGSSDGSETLLATIAAGAPEVRVIRHERNRGLTAALRTGFFGAAHDFVTWIPADGQIPPVELGKILRAWDGHDLVLSTYRHRPDGLRRAVMSRTLRLMLFAVTGLRDRLEGVYLFRRALLDEMALVSDRSAGSIGFEIAVKMRRLDKRVATTEIECAPRLSGRSKVANARNIVQSLGELWRIRRSVQQLPRP